MLHKNDARLHHAAVTLGQYEAMTFFPHLKSPEHKNENSLNV